MQIPRSQTNRIYFILSTTDLIAAITVPLLHILSVNIPQLSENCIFDMVRIQCTACITAMSAYTLCLLSMDRYLLVARPGNSDMPRKKFSLIVGGVVAASVLVPASRFLPGTVGSRVYTALVVVNAAIIIGSIVIAYTNFLRALSGRLRTNAAQSRSHEMSQKRLRLRFY